MKNQIKISFLLSNSIFFAICLLIYSCKKEDLLSSKGNNVPDELSGQITERGPTISVSTAKTWFKSQYGNSKIVDSKDLNQVFEVTPIWGFAYEDLYQGTIPVVIVPIVKVGYAISPPTESFLVIQKNEVEQKLKASLVIGLSKDGLKPAKTKNFNGNLYILNISDGVLGQYIYTYKIGVCTNVASIKRNSQGILGFDTTFIIPQPNQASVAIAQPSETYYIWDSGTSIWGGGNSGLTVPPTTIQGYPHGGAGGSNGSNSYPGSGTNPLVFQNTPNALNSIYTILGLDVDTEGHFSQGGSNAFNFLNNTQASFLATYQQLIEPIYDFLNLNNRSIASQKRLFKKVCQDLGKKHEYCA